MRPAEENVETVGGRTVATMTEELRAKAQAVDVSVWVGKAGLDAVVDELTGQLETKELVKVKFLRAARGARDTDELAADLAERADAELIETRGNTAVYH